MNKAIWDLVIADMSARDTVGRERYGAPLSMDTSIDGLQYAYEEALDLAVYLRYCIEKQKAGVIGVKK